MAQNCPDNHTVSLHLSDIVYRIRQDNHRALEEIYPHFHLEKVGGGCSLALLFVFLADKIFICHLNLGS